MSDQNDEMNDELEIEIVDDTPEPDKGKPKAPEVEAKAAFKAAYEAGDSDALAEAQLKLTELKGEEMRLAAFKPQRPAPQAEAPKPVQQQAPQVPKPSDRAMDWAQRNPWFGKDEEMTGYAYGVHERVIKSGVAPDSEEYYTAIDSAVRRVFADKFADEQKEEKPARKQMSSPVAPAGRQTSVTPRKVVLTSTQVALAKRLGLKPEEYAAQLIKDSSNG